MLLNLTILECRESIQVFIALLHVPDATVDVGDEAVDEASEASGAGVLD